MHLRLFTIILEPPPQQTGSTERATVNRLDSVPGVGGECSLSSTIIT